MKKRQEFVPLSPEQSQELATRFSLTAEDISGLRDHLCWALDPKTRRRSVLIVEAAKEGQAAVKAAMHDIDKAVKCLGHAASKLRLLDVSTPLGADTYISAVHPLYEPLYRASALAITARDLWSEALSSGMDISVRNLAVKRPKGDTRRRIVCSCIIRFWSDLDRPVSYTTDPLTGTRTGELVEFINAVVACVTAPSAKLGGETVRREITYAKARMEQELLLLHA